LLLVVTIARNFKEIYASNFNFFASDLAVWGELRGGDAAYKRSLKNLQKGLGKEHKALAKPYHGVASAQSALGRYDEAIANFGSAIRCKNLMSCYAGLGDTLYKTGDFNGAYVKHAVVFRICEEVFGADGVNLVRAKYYALMAGDLAGAWQ
jgi:tetratricopeptide repeat domain protein